PAVQHNNLPDSTISEIILIAGLGPGVPHKTQRKRAPNGAGDRAAGWWRRTNPSARKTARDIDDGGIDRVLRVAYVVNEHLHETDNQHLALTARQRCRRIKHRNDDERVAVSYIGDARITR